MHYFSLLPGSKIIIDEGGTLKIGKDQSLYVYDADQWGGYTSSTGKKFVPVRYAPSKTYTRTEADLVDAEILVNGTLDASSGKIYTTESGANIHSTGLDKTICSVCKKDLNKPVEVPALGHAEVTHEGKEPTYTEKGYETYHSRSRCDWCEEIVYIPVFGEAFSEGMDYVFSYKEYTSTGICVSLENAAENDLSVTVVLAAYDSTGKLISVRFVSAEIAAKASQDFTVTFPEGADVAKIKGFVLGSGYAPEQAVWKKRFYEDVIYA